MNTAISVNTSLPSVLFGTDGIRATAGSPQLTRRFAVAFGHACGLEFTESAGDSSTGEVLIARDTRASGDQLARAVAEGIAAAGGKGIILGCLPTPALSGLVRSGRAMCGIMITASHNPFPDNGYKVLESDGSKPSKQREQSIETRIRSVWHGTTLSASQVSHGKVNVESDLTSYLSLLRERNPAGFASGMRFVFDTAHGAACETARQILQDSGAEVIWLGNQPNGQNINEKCGSEFPAILQQEVQKYGAHLGLALDGDGDRILIVAEDGSLWSGDDVLVLHSFFRKKYHPASPDGVVGTVLSNRGLDEFLHQLGWPFARSSVGDREVYRLLVQKGWQLGGEPSGHILMTDHLPVSDGLMVGLETIRALKTLGMRASEIRNLWQPWPQRSVSLSVPEKPELSSLSTLSDTLRCIQDELGDPSQAVVRYSGTESKLRFMVVARTDSLAESCLTRLLQAARLEFQLSASNETPKLSSRSCSC